MKKTMLVAAVIALAGWAVASANQAEAVVEAQFVAAQQQDRDSVKRTLVEAENLPQGVKTALSAEEDSGWSVATAYHVEPEGKDAFYEISLERTGEENLRVIKMDADGNLKERDATPPIPPMPPTLP